MDSGIIYRDIAPGAAEDMTVTAAATADSDVSLLPFGSGNAARPSLELNAWGLDGNYGGEDTVAYRSDVLSGADGTFEAPPVVTLSFTEQYTAPGITLISGESDYCSSVHIRWYRNTALRGEADFTPNSGRYFCEKSVENFTSVEITFLQTRLPYRRAALDQVYIGAYRQFERDELRRVSVANETNLLSARLPASQLLWTLDSKSDVEYLFQRKQPVEAYLNGELFCVYYVTESARRGKGLYDVTCQDAFGVLDAIPFAGGIYDDVSAKALLTNVLGGRFPLYITAGDRVISGAILPGTLRDAVRQILFSWGVCAATDGCDGIRVFNIPSSVADIGRNRIFSGVSVKRDSAVTRVEVTGHEYAENESGGVEIGGVKYEDRKTVFTIYNPYVTPSDTENVVSVADATLVSPTNGQRAAKNVYDYFTGRNQTTAKVLWEGERLGDAVRVFNEWGGRMIGNIEKMEFVFSTITAATLTIRETEISEGRYFSGEVYAGEVDA